MPSDRLNVLVPKPRRGTTGPRFPTPLRVTVEGDWADGLPHALPDRGARPWSLVLRRDPDLPPQHYRLRLRPRRGTIAAGDRAGAWNGLQTVQQWLAAHRNAEIPTLAVDDHPDFARRGVTLDISRCRVPTMDHLRHLVDQLAGWKINRLQLYTEHSFAYAGHGEVWREASPLTPDDVRRLSAYCAEREMRLVPNQNSLGHFHRWLKHDSYRHLAECPDGIEHPFSPEPEPYGLCTTDPAVIDLLTDLYAQLLPNFDGDRFNVGCDEPLDLGRCRSRPAAEERGKAALFVEHVLRLRQLASRWGRTLEIWADAPLADREILDRLPDDIRLQAWGYEAGHDFAPAVEALAGRDFDLCPGTSSWASLGGRSRNALANLRQAARQGAGRAGGLVITDWGDFGHPQPPAVSQLGLLAGADLAWNSAGRDDESYRRQLEQHLGGGAGKALFDLGSVHEPLRTPNVNGTPLFHLLFHWRDGLDHDRYRALNRNDLAAVVEWIDAVAPPATNHPLAQAITWVRDGLHLGAELGRARLTAGGGGVRDLPAAERRRLAARLEPWRRDYPEVWLSTSRSGGLSESVSPVEELLGALTPTSTSTSGSAST